MSISVTSLPLPAHPRSRGENTSASATRTRATGSSPLTRGKLVAFIVLSFFEGLIPAHAGKTVPTARPLRGKWAHPRSRGENFRPRLEQGQDLGSSPLTRGKQQAAKYMEELGRLIPAHAGKTEHPRCIHRAHRAHPRSRGENTTMGSPTTSASGSSPLTRGKQLAEYAAPAARRLIPAHAGKTPSTRAASRGRRAHPRSRGEN